MKKLLIVMEKPSVKRWVLEFLGRHPEVIAGYDILFDYFGPVMDVRTCIPPFYKHADGWYLYGEPSNFEALSLPDLDLPADTYLVGKQGDNITAREFLGGEFSVDGIDRVWFVAADPWWVNQEPGDACVPDDIFAARKYLEVTGIPMDICQCWRVRDFLDDEFLMCRQRNMEQFVGLYSDVRECLMGNGFVCSSGVPNPFERILRLSHMKIGGFCEYFGVKRRTVENWKYGKSECPGWVLDLMEYKLKNEGII